VATVHTLADADRGRRVFAGEVLAFTGGAAVSDLLSVTDELVVGHLGPEPELAHRRLDAPSLRAAIDDLGRAWRGDPRVSAAFAASLGGTGADLRRLCWDRFKLRVQPPRDEHSTGTLGFHRDTWASNVYAQTNWWAPVYPVSEERTLALYPGYWTRPLANTSAGWDSTRLREMPLVPDPAEPVDHTSELRVVIPPGDLLCFSGAHLHASIGNTTARTRFSLEVRTVHLDDLEAGRGAPNVDGAARHVPWHWFSSVLDAVPLPQLRAGSGAVRADCGPSPGP
jgi:hypothetical protein